MTSRVEDCEVVHHDVIEERQLSGECSGAESLLGNQVPETIALCRLALEHGADAASAFGAGFGGSVWALVAAEYADRFIAAWRESYGGAFPVAAASAEFFVTRPGPGAMRL